MNKEKMLEIIEENAFMKYNICKLIETLKKHKEYDDIVEYLEQILGGENERTKRKYSDFK